MLHNNPLQEFAEDVLEILQTRNVTMYGCKPVGVELLSNGAKVWFQGHRNGKPWQGGLTVAGDDNISMIAMGDSNIFADAVEQGIDHQKCRFDM